MASTIHLIIQIARMTGGRRKLVSIAELTGLEGEVILMQDIFHFVQSGIDADGHAKGHFEACGIRPRVLQRMEEEGVRLPPEIFQRRRAS